MLKDYIYIEEKKYIVSRSYIRSGDAMNHAHDSIKIDFLEDPIYIKYYSKIFKTHTTFSLIQAVDELCKKTHTIWAYKENILKIMEDNSILGSKRTKDKLEELTNFGLLRKKDDFFQLTEKGTNLLDLQEKILNFIKDVIKSIHVPTEPDIFRKICVDIVNQIGVKRHIDPSLNYFFGKYQKDLHNWIQKVYSRKDSESIIKYLEIYDEAGISLEDYIEGLRIVSDAYSCELIINLAKKDPKQNIKCCIKVDEIIKSQWGYFKVVEHQEVLIKRFKNKERDLIGFLNICNIPIKCFCNAIYHMHTNEISMIKERIYDKYLPILPRSPMRTRGAEVAMPPYTPTPQYYTPAPRSPMRTRGATAAMPPYTPTPTINPIENPSVDISEVSGNHNTFGPSVENAPKISGNHDTFELIGEYFRLSDEIEELEKYINENQNLIDEDELWLLKVGLKHLEVEKCTIEKNKEVKKHLENFISRQKVKIQPRNKDIDIFS
ncbi:MAG: hypothetical protein ACE5J9_04285 [Methanosarcinales archaeon]